MFGKIILKKWNSSRSSSGYKALFMYPQGQKFLLSFILSSLTNKKQKTNPYDNWDPAKSSLGPFTLCITASLSVNMA